MNRPDYIPDFARPEILCHPNIPKPLHGLNPRSILGDKWWDKKRKESYAHHNFHCWACGIHKKNAEFHKWLEAHEYYEYDYDFGRAKLVEIVALCHSCHNFIHSGRLWSLYNKGEIQGHKMLYILDRGMSILKDCGLQAFQFTQQVYEFVLGMRHEEPTDPLDLDPIPWSDWRLEIENKLYEPKFVDKQAWADHYGEIDKK